MRYVRFFGPDGPHWGIADEQRIFDAQHSGIAASLEELIAGGEARWQLANALALDALPTFPLTGTPLLTPLQHPSKIVAIGLNYLDHCREQGVAPPDNPLVFAKFPSTLTGPTDPIQWNPALTTQVDPEVELAVIIGKHAKNVSASEALSVVFGYTVANDVSARDLQFGDGQWIRGKNFDTFCPLGPAIVTADEIPDPQALRLNLRVNGRIWQEGTTAEMIFPVADIITFVTQFMTLNPGDIILTGTPWGVGIFQQPPVFLQEGDQVEASISSIGTLRNRAQHISG